MQIVLTDYYFMSCSFKIPLSQHTPNCKFVIGMCCLPEDISGIEDSDSNSTGAQRVDDGDVWGKQEAYLSSLYGISNS